jgi:hypothetical protein
MVRAVEWDSPDRDDAQSVILETLSNWIQFWQLMRYYVKMITLLGKRTKEALETLKCAKALDAFQDGRHLGKFERR